MKRIQRHDEPKIGLAVWLLLWLFAINPLCAQAPVVKSNTIEQYNGKTYYLHTVTPKQTLYSISKVYNVDQETIMNTNPDISKGLRVNQVIRIPASNNVTAYSSNTRTSGNNQTVEEDNVSDFATQYETIYHVAKQDDRFNYIAEIYLVPENNIRLANPGLKEPLSEGEYVLVPIAPKDKRPPVTSQERFQRSDYNPFQTPQNNEKQQASKLPGTNPAPVKLPEIDDRQPNQQESLAMVEPFAMPGETKEATAEKPSQSNKGTTVSSQQYVVKPGETLYSISRKQAVGMEALIALNPGIANGVKAGQVLLLPEDSAPNPAVSSQNTGQADTTLIHIVKKGETLYRISRNYAVDLEKLKAINPGLTNDIRPGQRIVVPKKKITRPYLIHNVEKRQRTKRLAKDFDVDSDEIFDLNPSIGRRVFPGQKIKVPLLDHIELSPLEPEMIETPTEIATDTVVELSEERPFESVECTKGLYHSDQTFKVALMLPLYLDDFDKMEAQSTNGDENLLNQKHFSFLAFYEGFLIAADSLAKTQGLKLELKVYDVDMNISKALNAISDSELSNSDLIIGPFFNKAFEVVAPFALRHQIPIVNPFSQRNEIISNNQAVIKVKPSQVAQIDQLTELITERYPDSKIYIYRSHQFKYTAEAEALQSKLQQRITPMVGISSADIYRVAKERSKKMELEDDLIPFIRIEKREFYPAELSDRPFDTIYFNNPVSSFVYATDSVREFAKTASVVRENVVIVFSDDKVFSTEFVNKMNQVADTFSLTLIGLPDWEQFDQLFVENLMKMKATYFSPMMINYNDYFTQLFIKEYRNEYLSEPDRYAFEGFDIGWYFLQALLNLGDNPLPCLPQFQIPLLQSQYYFDRPSQNNGLENTYWNVYQFNRFKRVPVPNSYFINKDF
ncbi:MAG: LysM peptidoglycan-binding domain-containing protein [Bacteroidetes bacterium]|nr:LysM peptidoglycan-binding domain-containing protein [Bacteroidota bacterium]